MGVLNLTPDSFSDGGAFFDAEHPERIDRAFEQARRLAAEGAELLDLGGESTRPGAPPVDEEEERRRVLPLLRRLAREEWAWLSVDTRRAGLAAEAAALGAVLVNDVSGGEDPALWALVAEQGLPCVVMHMQGTPQTMQVDPRYQDPVAEVEAFLLERAEALQGLGLAPQRVLLDPGIGFGKTLEHNRALLAGLAELAGRAAARGHALLLGASRKSFIGQVEEAAGLAASAPGGRLGGSLAAALWGARAGARVLRVHDAAATRQALQIWRWLEGRGPWS
jgi:dihydropteroate synthase